MINGLGRVAKLALGLGTAGAVAQTALYDGTSVLDWLIALADLASRVCSQSTSATVL